MMILWRFLRLTVSLPSVQTISATVRALEKPEQMGFFAEKNGWDYIIKDEEILRLAMKQTYPNVPFVLFGHSMGSFMARTHLIRYPGGFDAAIISGTGNQGAHS